MFLNSTEIPDILSSTISSCIPYFSGQGFDRHLFAMKHLAESSGKVPEFYRDPGYTHPVYLIF